MKELRSFERSLERYVKVIPFIRHVSLDVVNVGDLVDVFVNGWLIEWLYPLILGTHDLLRKTLS